jgi:hypothetical protein
VAPQSDSQRIAHDVEKLPSTARLPNVYQQLNDLEEENSGAGYTDVTYTGPFVTGMTTWESVAKALKRSDVVFAYSGPFVTTIVKRYFDEATGTAVVSTATSTISYTANKQVDKVTTVTTRP